MPCAVDYILEGLAKNLELEMELGVFSVEFDRDFLVKLPKRREQQGVVEVPSAAAVWSGRGRSSPAGDSAKKLDFVFLHHGPITGPGVEMMAKLIAAMKQTPERAPVVFNGEKPAAKVYVVLGTKALSKWYDGVSLVPCGWFRDDDSEVLLVYSPEDIYRFGTNLSAAMVQRKRDMWKSLQEAMRKVS